MADEATTKVAPTLAELEAKVSRLSNQVEADKKLASDATDAFSKAVKSGNVDAALDLADKRTSAQVTVGKSISQHKSAMAAVQSAKWAANAEQMATIHDQIRSDKAVVSRFEALEAFGVVRLVVERSSETGKLLINSSGPTLKRTKGSGGGGNGKRGQPVTVDGTEYASASAAHLAFFPDAGPLNRQSIIDKITNAGHEVS